MDQVTSKTRRMTGAWRADWICRPLHTLPPWLRLLAVLVLTSFTGAFCLYLQRYAASPFSIPDHEHYVEMARGRGVAVPQPFASRPLAPLLARELAKLGHTTLEHGFVTLGLISLFVTLLVVFSLTVRSAAPRWVLLLIAITPFWPQLLQALALPDLPSAALLCGLLLCLAADRPLLAAATLFPLMVARESTSLTLVCLLAVSWRRLRWPGCTLAVGAVAAGAVAVRLISPAAGGNAEGLPTVVYLAAKVPWNFLRLLGIVPWSNLYPALCKVPVWQMGIHLGPLRSLGVCSILAFAPLLAARALLTTFGVLPAVLLTRLLRRGRPWGGQDLLTRFCLLYGGISLVLAPLIGTEYARLYGYAWPLFFVALPRMFALPSRLAGEEDPRCTDVAAEAPGEANTPPEPRWPLAAVAILLALQLSLNAVEVLNVSFSFAAWAAGAQIAAALLLTAPRGGLLRASKTA